MSRAVLLVLFALAAAPNAAAAIEVHATVDARSVGLGDTFRYTVEAKAASGNRLVVVADPGPFLVVSAPTTTRTDDGGTAVVRTEQTLMCVDRGCAPDARPRRVRLPVARVLSGGASASAAPVAITVVPRVSARAVAAARAAYRRQVGVAAPSTRIAPGVLAALLIAGAVLLVACAVLLLSRELRHPRRRAVRGAAVGSLERALRFLRESAGRSAPDRRRAADYAARAAGGAEVAAEATRTAWAPPDPGPADVDALADRIENALGSRP